MTIVNMHQAKTNLSRYVEAIESGVEQEVIIARNGKPAARLVAVDAPARKARVLGQAKGKFTFDDDAFFALDAEVQSLFDQGIDDDRKKYGW
jgi:antitoxin (DNA-binding transcriptional repressor) of toxin-antitoxin stability system